MAESVNKRDAIVQTTLDLIVERGLESTPMSLIAQEAGVGMGTIYNYFPSKEALVNALYHELKTKMHKAMLQNYTREAPLRERFFRIWRNIFVYFLHRPSELIFLEQYTSSPIISPENRELDQQIWTETLQLFDEAFQQQLFKELPVSLLTSIASAPVFDLVREHAAGRITLDTASIELTITACWDAIKR